MSKAFRSLNIQTLAGLILIAVIIAIALLADVISPFDPNGQDLSHRLSAPGENGFVLGSDRFGRDVLSRIIHGSRVSLIVAVGVTALAALLGGILGIAGGYFGGRVDALIGRVIDVLMSFPGILLALAIIAALGPSLPNTIIAIAVTMSPTYARVTRAAVLSTKQREFVRAARAMGSGTLHILAKHIVPNSLAPVIVTATVGAATAILAEATLSFLGLGTQPPAPTWGNLISDGKEFLESAPWIAYFAGGAIVVTVFALTLIGDGLRDHFDPKILRTVRRRDKTGVVVP